MPFAANHLGQVALTVSDVDRAERFYGEALGLRTLFRFGDLLFFDMAGVRLLVEKAGDPSRLPCLRPLLPLRRHRGGHRGAAGQGRADHQRAAPNRAPGRPRSVDEFLRGSGPYPLALMHEAPKGYQPGAAAARLRAMPSLSFERACGRAPVCGVDEVGRGPLAGPVLACAAILDPARLPQDLLLRLDDSKKLSAKARAEIALALREVAIFAIAEASVLEIDEINILRASHLAMRRAVAALAQKLDPCAGRRHSGTGSFLQHGEPVSSRGTQNRSPLPPPRFSRRWSGTRS